MSTVQSGNFVHVVASVNLTDGTGKLLYVNPSKMTVGPTPTPATPGGAPGPAADKGFELVVEDAAGQELRRFRPSIQIPSDTEGKATTGLIDENIPKVEGMKRLVLVHGDRRVSVYEAGSSAPAVAEMAAGLSMGVAPSGHPEKREMRLNVGGPKPGVSYTVQVRPKGTKIWQTISVGRSTPEFVIDRNQFAGADKAAVRVLRTTGFEDEVIAEKEVDLDFKE